jgi:adenosylmethionine-8-amino-7-oxononanoate aminotransferase
LIGNARRTGAYLRSALMKLMTRSPIVGDVRGMGLLTAVELVADKTAKAPFPPDVYVSNRLRLIGLQHGLILYARRQSGGKAGEWSMIGPPLITSCEQIDEIVERLGRALDQLTNEMAAEGHFRNRT